MIQKFIEFSIRKPLLNHFFLFFILMLSIFAYINIPKEIFPPIQMDKVSINGGYSGTSADVLDKLIVQNIEDDLQNISEIDSIKTVIKNGIFSIEANIKPGSENIKVLSDVKDIISLLKRDLPSDMNEPTAKIHEETIPLVLIAVAADVETRELLEKTEELKRVLSKYKDLSELSIRGDADEELVIRLNDEKIRAYNLEYNAVILALQNLSSIFPIGTIKEKGQHLYISTFNGEKNSADIADSIIQVGGVHVRVGDVCDISFELSDESELSHYNGLRNISLNITKSKEGNSITLVKSIRKELALLNKKYPHIKFEVYTDTSIWIKNRLNTVVANILFGLMLVFLSMLVFVNRGIALVVAMGIPLSFMIGLIATNAIGYSLNMLSLLGALIALGMLVDEAIVVAENIYRHLEEGKSRKEAAIVGASEMFPAVLTATLTTIFAFLPLLLISGEMGVFIKILPIMISILLVSSLFEAFYFLPLHSYDFLRLRKEGHLTHSIWEYLYTRYEKVLHVVLKKPAISLLIMLVSIFGATGYFIQKSKFQLFPDFDVTQIYITGKVNINNDLYNTEEMVTTLEKELLKNLDPEEFSSVTSVIGMRLDAKSHAELGENLFHIFIDLHERKPDNFFNQYINPLLSLEYNATVLKRARTALAITKDVKAYLAPYIEEEKDGVRIFEELNIDVPGTGVVAHDIEILLSGKEDAKLVEGIEYLSENMRKIEGIEDVANDAEKGEKELKLKVNSYGQLLGFNETILNQELRSYYLKGEYSKMFNESGLVRIKMEGSLKDSITSIENFSLHVPNTNRTILLSEVCDFIYTQAYVAINKEDSKKIRSVFASMDNEKITASEAMKKIEPSLEKLREEGFFVTIKGEQQENEKTQREMMQAALMALVLIFITLVWLFDSLLQTFIIISTMPLVILGVYVGHDIMSLNMTMTGLIGVVGLMGVVVNDGLIMVSFIKKATDVEELVKLAKTRLRPILLTSITTVLGLSTLIFFASGQAKILQPMAVSLGFGILWATVLNLVYVPLLYQFMNNVKAKFSKKSS